MPHLVEIALRVGAVYLALLLMLRVGGKREMSELTPFDLLTMLLLSETVSPALTANSDSVGSGLFAAATLVALSMAMGWLTFRYRWFDRAVEGRARLLIDRGRLLTDVARQERITDQRLHTALHEYQALAVEDVHKAFIEPSGQITIIRKQDVETT